MGGDGSSGDDVSVEEAELFLSLLEDAMDEFIERTGRDEMREELVEKVVGKMGEAVRDDEQ